MPAFVLSRSAFAKTNLSLRIVRKREDGFHELDTVMTRLQLADFLRLRKAEEGEQARLICVDPNLPTDERNLVVRAWKLLEQTLGRELPAVIELEKNIPVSAGLGGGSSDAAETLLGLIELFSLEVEPQKLLEIAAQLGSDVPFFLKNGVCRCFGRGELIEEWHDYDWELPIVLLKPPYGIAAAEAYQNWQSAKEIAGVSLAPQLCPWGEMVNDLERPVFAKYFQLASMKNWLRAQPEVHAALLSGSGSTMLAVLASQQGGENLLARARDEFGSTLWGWVGSTQAQLR